MHAILILLLAVSFGYQVIKSTSDWYDLAFISVSLVLWIVSSLYLAHLYQKKVHSHFA